MSKVYEATHDVTSIKAAAAAVGFQIVGGTKNTVYFVPDGTPSKANAKKMYEIMLLHAKTPLETGLVKALFVGMMKGEASRQIVAEYFKYDGEIQQIYSQDSGSGWASIRNLVRDVPLLIPFTSKADAPKGGTKVMAISEEQNAMAAEADEMFA